MAANFYAGVEKLQDALTSMKAKTTEKLTETKEQVCNLYSQVMRRIKEKEIQITTEWACNNSNPLALDDKVATGEMIPA